MNFSVSSNIAGLLNRLSKVKSQQNQILKQSLKESGIFMAASTKAGYMKSKDPDGQDWEKLGYKYRPMADGVIRPPKRRVDSSSKPLINTGAMMGSINYALVGSESVIIGYQTPKEAKKALAMQLGTPGTLIIETNGKTRKKDIKPKIRKNMGFAKDWARLGGSNDIEQIKKIFQKALGVIVKVIAG